MTSAIVRSLTVKETVDYISNRLGVSLSVDHIKHLRAELKRDSIAAIEQLRKDQHAFVQACFWNRIDEWNEQQRILYEVIANETSKAQGRDNDVIIHAVDRLDSITTSLFNAYSYLPSVASMVMVVQQRQQQQTPLQQQQSYDNGDGNGHNDNDQQQEPRTYNKTF